MFVSIGEASTLVGVAVSTLRRWEKEERFLPKFRTKGNHRRYCMNDIQNTFLSQSASLNPRHNICYARVSSHDQREDLERQKQRLETYCNDLKLSYEVISDLGFGLNYNKKGLNILINKICSQSVDTLSLKFLLEEET